MKSFTGKFTSVRGWALLFTLLLGAGLFVAACGEEETPAPTTPTPTPPPPPTPTPPTPEPTGPATPTGLRASAGDGYIEWTWNAVENVLGYQGQFSMDAVFTDVDTTFLIVAPQTSHRVHNQTSGYFRVRSGVGTAVTDLQYSDWSDAVSGSTAPPAAVPLSVPGSVAAGSPRNDTITVTWGAVADAEAYEVQQRADGAWSSASCGAGGDNRVVGTECVASGLDSGTAYDFRVRAVPAASATGSAASAWSSAATATTTGRAQVMLEDGGLNLQWKSELDVRTTPPAHAITWIWDPVVDRALQPLVDHYVALLDLTDEATINDECPSLDRAPVLAEAVADGTLGWVNLDSDISLTVRPVGSTDTTDVDGDPGEVRGLCVVRAWEDERGIRQFGHVSLAWGSTLPAGAGRAADGTLPATPTAPSIRHNDVTRATTSISWSFEIDGGFSYVLRVLSTSRDNNAPSDVAECSGGKPVDAPRTVNANNFRVSHSENNPDPYTHYRLCIRAENDHGASDWWFVGTGQDGEIADVQTRPAAACAPTYVASQSEVTTEGYGGHLVTRMVWSCTHKDGTPLNGDLYERKVLRTTTRTVPSNQVQATCEGGADITGGTLTLASINTNSGFEIELDDSDATDADGIIGNTVTGVANTPDEYYIHACVRADPDNAVANDEGLWSISSAQRFVAGKPADVTSLAELAGAAAGHASWDWDRMAGANGYVVRVDGGATINVAQPALGTRPDYDYNAPAGTAQGTNVGLNVRQYQTFGGTRLLGDWLSSDATASVQ